MAEFISTDDPRWRQALSRLRHDVYHTPEFVGHAGRHEGATPVAYYARNDRDICLIPLLIRPLPPQLEVSRDWYDATSPYGYPAPIMGPGWDEESARRLLAEFQHEAARRNIVSVFLRWHPLLPLPAQASTADEQFVREGQTVYIDLTLPEQVLAWHVRRGHRYEINRLARSGFHATMDDWSLFDRYRKIYEQTMARVGANSRYFFSKDYFQELRSSLGDQLHLGCVISPEGDLAAASLFTESQGIVQFHLSGTAEDYWKQSPTKLLLCFTRDWARERRNRWLHLGGGLGGQEDSLFAFKAGFSKLRASFRTSRIILDRRKYSALVDRWTTAHPTRETGSNFFPMYRRAA
jgi:hypothetical protein